MANQSKRQRQRAAARKQERIALESLDQPDQPEKLPDSPEQKPWAKGDPERRGKDKRRIKDMGRAEGNRRVGKRRKFNILKRLTGWKSMLAQAGGLYILDRVLGRLMPDDEIPERFKGKDREDLKEILASLSAERDSPTTRAVEEVAGLDRQMRLEREIAAQAPPGTPPATPILDRLQTLQPDLLSKLRKRMAAGTGGLWSALAGGEVLVDGSTAPPSRAEKAGLDSQLETVLRSEINLGVKSSTSPASIDREALMR